MLNGSIAHLLKYLRINLCIFCAFMALSGYLMFNLPSGKMIFVILSAFLVCAGTYSFNNITDKKEDAANGKSENPFTSVFEGKVISVAALLLGGILSAHLSSASFMFYISSAASGIVYSYLRIKKYLFIKNIYTGFGVMQAFLIGAAATSLTFEAVLYYVALSFFIMILSMISDIRDYKGDKAAGIRTVPVCFGYAAAKALILSLLVAYFVLILAALPKLTVMLPFSAITLLLMHRDNARRAHFFGSLSFVFLTAWLLI
ncbi:MAG: UbiA family prenyltransferase [Nanoarchaeota archaeon]|nr:UbiA family prenyltransferase [Nanoarchaeota archaeon]